MSKNNYEYIQLSYVNDLRDAMVPKFQRSLVWSRQKKLDLLKTLHKGFPFGALLVVPTNKNGHGYRILDGQQRLSTIKDFDQHKLGYWKLLDKSHYQEMLDNLNQELAKSGIKSINAKVFDSLFDDQFDPVDFTDNENDSYYQGHIKDSDRKTVRKMIKNFKHEVDHYIDLNSLLIPVIKFIGDESDLPEVYENLNRGGTPLTKYEVLNASWSDENIKIPDDFPLGDELLNDVKEYYNQIRQTGIFELDDFSEDDITNTREINLAELGRALGSMVVQRIPSLASSTSNSVNEFGFGLLGIITNTDNKKIATIHNQSSWIQEHIQDILNQADRLSNRINAPFEKLLKQNIEFGTHLKSKKKSYVDGLSTTFKILSYFASLWNRDEQYIKDSLANIPAYYVYDYLNRTWTGHGDQRLFQYYPLNQTRNYLTPLNDQDFKVSFKNWLIDNPGNRKRFSKEVKALITIHSNLTYLSSEIPASEDYEFEHVIPKARILASDPTAKNVHVSNLGNGMFLPKSLNNSKSSKTLYEYTKDRDVDYHALIKDSDYFSAYEFKTIFSDLDNNEFEPVNQMIDQRAMRMAGQIIHGLNPRNNTFFEMKTKYDPLKRNQFK